MTAIPLEAAGWPMASLDAALAALLQKSGLQTAPSVVADTAGTGATVPERIEQGAAAAGCEAVPVLTTFRQIPLALRQATPCLIILDDHRCAAVLEARGPRLRVLTPDLQVRAVLSEEVARSIREPVKRESRAEYQGLLAAGGLSADRLDRATAALLDERFGGRPFHGVWQVRTPIGDGELPQFLRRAGVFRMGAYMVGAHVCEYLLWLAAWYVMGRLSFSGRMDHGWLLGWALLLMTTIPFRVATTWLQGVSAIALSACLKRRLLAGALSLDRDAVRQSGIGSFLGQALEAEAVETFALSGGVAGMLAVIELLFAGALLGYLAFLLLLWCGVLGLFAYLFWQRYDSWTSGRMAMTQDLIERMAGQRTRVAQQAPEDWHTAENALLTDYLGRSQRIDRTGTWLVSAVPRTWLLAGMLALIPSAMAGASAGPALAVKLGGVLLAYTALRKMTASALDVVAAFVAAGRLAPLFHLAQKREPPGQLLGASRAQQPGLKLLEADHVSYRYRAAGLPALQPTNLTVRCGEKVLLEGSSGGGKTTFASLLSGIRTPASGLLLLHGLDHHTIGASCWRKRIAAAPQFHENYILTETLAFNLLLGRSWPPTQQDLEEAEELCRKLGLGDLLDRMPGGMEQLVGEGGWQLSHGERSRIYVARALLQQADLVILDESFGALDPENLIQSLECTLQQAQTLLVIAHP